VFLQFEKHYQPGRTFDPLRHSVTDLNDLQVLGLLETAWANRYLEGSGYLEPRDVDIELSGSASPNLFLDAMTGVPTTSGQRKARWENLIFAYLVEMTGIEAIVARILLNYGTWQYADVPGPRALHWLETTQSLFYTFPSRSSLMNLTSALQPDIRAIRSEDYARMFGLPVTIPRYDGQPYPTPNVPTANKDFVAILEMLLYEVWRAYSERNNSSGANETDVAAISSLARRLYDLMQTTRRNGVFDRREFVHISTMAWFYLIIQADYPIILDMRAQASSPYERLRNLGARVGLAPHSRSEHFLYLADTLPYLLMLIETGVFNREDAVAALYKDLPSGTVNTLQQTVLKIITNWEAATGHNIKGTRTVLNPAGIRVPTDGRAVPVGPARARVLVSRPQSGIPAIPA